MEISLYFKDGINYSRQVINLTDEYSWDFIKSLQLTMDSELEKIKKDLLPYINESSIARPKALNLDDRKKVEILSEMRKSNIQTKKVINDILRNNESIICECSGKMIKTPVDIVYEKIKGKFILKNSNEAVKYVYMCENCFRAISEDIYLEIKSNEILRTKLIESGESYIPNKFGLWHWIKSPIQKRVIEGCDHAWKRTFENINIKSLGSSFIKITETCFKCGEVNYIR
jgi:hypothetical protein